MIEERNTDRAYNYVIDKIKTSEWTPNTKILSENELANELNLSRVSVREAYEKLDALGLIVRKKGSGTFINNMYDEENFDVKAPVLLMKDSDILELLKFRKFFEFGNIRMYIDRFDSKDLILLQNKVDIMEHTKSHADFAEADFEFHDIIAKGTANQLVMRINIIMMRIFEEHQLVLNKRIGPKVGLEYHSQILKAISTKDKELASLLILRHIDAAIEDFKKTSTDLF